MTIIYLIRHGETMWNREKRLQGHLDIGLNDNGRRQADLLALHMAQKNLAAIISSDLSRAMDTALPIAKHHELDLQLDPQLRERHYGVMQGLSHEEIEKLHPENHQAWKNRDVSFQPKDGESLLQFDGRVVQAARRWAEEFKQYEIALVAHGGVLDCLHRAATQKPLEQARDFEILNASLSTLKYQNGQFSLIQWGDVSHLNDLQLSKSLDEVDGSPR